MSKRIVPLAMQVMLNKLKIAYALVAQDGSIIEHDSLFALWLLGEERQLNGAALFDVLPEFIGQESVLEDIRKGREPLLQLANVNRTTAQGETRYLVLNVVANQLSSTIPMMVLLTDVTEQAERLQQLMQSRNELYLAQRRLAQLNSQLDYLLRHYVPRQVADALLEGQLRPELGGELRQVSLLFADARGFTASPNGSPQSAWCSC